MLSGRELALRGKLCRGETLTVTPHSHMHKASEDTLYKFLQYTSVPDWWGHDGARHELRRRTEYTGNTATRRPPSP